MINAETPEPVVGNEKSRTPQAGSLTRQMLSKVPEATLGFWIIKIVATTLGEVGGNALSMLSP